MSRPKPQIMKPSLFPFSLPENMACVCHRAIILVLARCFKGQWIQRSDHRGKMLSSSFLVSKLETCWEALARLSVVCSTGAIQVCWLPNADKDNVNGDARWRSILEVSSTAYCRNRTLLPHRQLFCTQCRGIETWKGHWGKLRYVTRTLRTCFL
jgi:hypothetical protein